MRSPSSHLGDRVSALSTKPALGNPKGNELLPLLWIGHHFQVKPTLKVRFPERVVRVGVPPNLDVTDDWHGAGVKEPSDNGIALFVEAPCVEDISFAVEALEILIEYPPPRLVRMSSARPAPKAVENSR